jgi:hypothetical protein
MSERIELSFTVYDQAKAEKLTLSKYLEKLYPTPEGSKLDAFERALKQEGIIVKSVYEKGIYADPVDAFYRTETSRVLFPEFIARTVREAIVEDTVLPYLIGQNTTIDTDTYRTFYVEDQPTKSKKVRITEAADLPVAVIRGKDQVVRLYKFGRAIDVSYEALRRMAIDMLALHIRRIAIQTAKDKVEEILNVIKNGDGNNNAAPVLKLSVLDSGATPGTITPKALLKFLMEFEPFPCDTLIASKDAFVQLVLTDVPNLDTATLLRLLATGVTSGVNFNAPQMPNGTVRLFWNANITGNQIYGINRRYAIEQITEAGSDIREADKFIKNQTQILTISENTGYSKMFPEATKILDLDQ